MIDRTNLGGAPQGTGIPRYTFGRCRAAVDTGTYLIYGPKDAFQAGSDFVSILVWTVRSKVKKDKAVARILFQI